MGCLSCAERARLMRQAAGNAIKGQSPRPQVAQIAQTVKNDLARIRAAAIARTRKAR